MKKAIVTLTIGESYVSNFDKYCKRLWLEYASKYDYDLVNITEPIDISPRAESRNPAWQKCLVLSHPEVQQYDQVVWIDSDILINTNSPDICKDIPLDKIGAVDVYATPNKEDHKINLSRLYDYWDRNGIKFINNLTATEFHVNFGLEGEFDSAVQTGVMVLSPKYHRELFEYVYHHYEDKGPSYWCYEMRPLSYEILKNGFEFWVFPKFNMTWPDVKQSIYPFLNSNPTLMEKALDRLGLLSRDSLITKCATTAYLNNYFLHFASTADEMKYVDSTITSIFDL